MCIILVNPASALIAGTSDTVMSFPECAALVVEVEGDLNIESGEYWFEDCTETLENKWSCDCYDDYELVMGLDLLTMNSYNLTATYSYTEHTEDKKRSKGFSVRYNPVESNETMEIGLPTINATEFNGTIDAGYIQNPNWSCPAGMVITQIGDSVICEKIFFDEPQPVESNHNIWWWSLTAAGIVIIGFGYRRLRLK